MDAPVNKRDYERIKIDGIAVLIIDENTKKGLIIKDISARGVRGQTTLALAVGQRVKLIIQSSFLTQPLERGATVVWCGERGRNLWEIGLDFGMNGKIDIEKIIRKD